MKANKNPETREQILDAALKCFAHSGYAAASVQQIVSTARVSKPVLYYYFRDKARLFQTLVDTALDERYRLMREAAARTSNVRARLTETLVAMFDYFRKNRELMRIAFATAFASPGEIPKDVRYLHKCERNFDFVHSLMKKALANGELNGRFDSRELAFGFYGQMNVYLMAHLMMPGCRLNRATAERVVDLFMTGASAKQKRK